MDCWRAGIRTGWIKNFFQPKVPAYFRICPTLGGIPAPEVTLGQAFQRTKQIRMCVVGKAEQKGRTRLRRCGRSEPDQNDRRRNEHWGNWTVTSSNRGATERRIAIHPANLQLAKKRGRGGQGEENDSICATGHCDTRLPRKREPSLRGPIDHAQINGTC